MPLPALIVGREAEAKMVRQAVKQTYTYYTPKTPQGEIVEDDTLQGHGRVWTLGAYEHPTYPSPANVRVGDAGIKVWMVIKWLKLCDNDVDSLLSRYPNTVTREDVEVALWYYERYKDWIDQKLSEEAELL